MKKIKKLCVMVACILLLCSCGDIPEERNKSAEKVVDDHEFSDTTLNDSETILPENTRGWDYSTLFDDIYLSADEKQRIQLERLLLRYSSKDYESDRTGINGLQESGLYTVPFAKRYTRKILQAVGKLPAKNRYITLDEVENAIETANRRCDGIDFSTTFAEETAMRNRVLNEICLTQNTGSSGENVSEKMFGDFNYTAENYDKLADYYSEIQNRLHVNVRGIYDYAATVEEILWLSEFVDSMNQYVGAPDEVTPNGLFYWMDDMRSEWIAVYYRFGGPSVSYENTGAGADCNGALLFYGFYSEQEKELVGKNSQKSCFEQAREASEQYREFMKQHELLSDSRYSDHFAHLKAEEMTDFEYEELLLVIDSLAGFGNSTEDGWGVVRDTIATAEQKKMMEEWERNSPKEFFCARGCKKRFLQILGFLPEQKSFITVRQLVDIYENNNMSEWDQWDQSRGWGRAFRDYVDEIVGAADWEGGSGIARAIYLLDETYSRWITITEAMVFYYDREMNESIPLITLGKGINEEGLKTLGIDVK